MSTTLPSPSVRDRKELITVWQAATLKPHRRHHRPSKRQLASVNIAELCQQLLSSQEGIALKFVACLLLGMTNVLWQQSHLIYEDVLHLWTRIQRDLILGTFGNVDMPNPVARRSAITLHEPSFIQRNTGHWSVDDLMALWHTQRLSVEDVYRLQDDEMVAFHSHDPEEAVVPDVDSEQAQEGRVQGPQQANPSLLYPITHQDPFEAWGEWDDFLDASDQVAGEPHSLRPEVESDEGDPNHKLLLGQTSDDILADIVDDHRLNALSARRHPSWRRTSLSDGSSGPSSGERWTDDMADPWMDATLSEHTDDFSFIVPQSNAEAIQTVPSLGRRRLDRHGTTVPAGFYTANTTTTMSRSTPPKSKRQRTEKRHRTWTLLHSTRVPALLPAYVRLSRSDENTVVGQSGSIEHPRRQDSAGLSDEFATGHFPFLASHGSSSSLSHNAAAGRDRSALNFRLEPDDDRRSSSHSSQRRWSASFGMLEDGDTAGDDLGCVENQNQAFAFDDPLGDISASQLYFDDTHDFLTYARLFQHNGRIRFADLFPSVVSTLKSEVAQAFHHVLVLASRHVVRPVQTHPYGDIDIHA